MDRPDAGELSLGGTRAVGLGDSERSRLRNERLGFVFQFDSLLPEFTILENVMMPARIARARGLTGDIAPTHLPRSGFVEHAYLPLHVPCSPPPRLAHRGRLRRGEGPRGARLSEGRRLQG
jgi:predicted ABC-type transport system involved in lysophospholipase L1 biosynthesis ATPase subunit